MFCDYNGTGNAGWYEGAGRDLGSYAGEKMRPVRVNKHLVTYLITSPIGKRGMPGFDLTFSIDRSRLLRLTAREGVSGTLG